MQFSICSFQSLAVGAKLNNPPHFLPYGYVSEVRSNYLVAGMSLRALLVQGKSQKLTAN